MTDLLRAFAYPVFTGAGAVVLFLGPFFGIAVFLHRKRKRFRAEALEPFTLLPLRPPGESLRLKIESLSEEFDSTVVVAAMVGLGCTLIVITAPPQHRILIAVFFFIVALAVYAAAGRKLAGLQKQLWNYRLGFTGERVVGEELNQLIASGFRVFHDVPFEGFNIDHVLIGPPGVFAVETKSPRKRASIKGVERATVYSDGQVLKFPTWTDTRFIAQTRRNAETLSTWLSSATGEFVAVRGILTLPGWRIERLKPGDVNVLRPDEIKRSFPNRVEKPFSPQQIQRIAHQLTERCRLSV